MIHTDLTSKIKYKRILLKYSGEALANGNSFDEKNLNQITNDIAELIKSGVEVGLVVGGGNLCRGRDLALTSVEPVTADYMGMLATMMNALALQDVLKARQVNVEIMSSLPITGVIQPYMHQQAKNYLSQGTVVIFAAGLGHPSFTTDSAACLRAIEIDAQIVLKATKVNGIYSADPLLQADAKKYEVLTYRQILQDNLQVMDRTAICLCQENNLLLQVFDMRISGALIKIIHGEQIGTLVRA